MKLWKYNSVKLSIFITILLSVTSVLASYALSYLVVDSKTLLIRNAIFILGIHIAEAILVYFREHYKCVANYYLTMDINKKIDKAISEKSYNTFMSKESGEHTATYTNDVSSTLELLYEKYISLVSKVAITISIIIALFKIHYSMVIICIASSAVMTLIPMLFQKTLSNYIISKQHAREEYLNKVRELMQGFQVFFENKAFSLFFKKSREASHKCAESVFESRDYAGIMSGVLTMTNSLSTIAALFVLSFFVIEGKVEVGSYLAVAGLLPSFGESIMGFMADTAFYKSGKELYKSNLGFIDGIKDTDTKYKRAFFMSRKVYKKVRDNMEILATSEINRIETKDIKFIFDKKVITINPNTKFEGKNKYAIIGASGCGKSSLLKAIIGETDEYEGEITINGKVKEKNKSMLNEMAYMNQNTYLFNDTIKNNIQMDLELSDGEISKLLQIVKLDDLDSNYVITENGKNLSGGQRQRIALARVIARKKKVIILDEATANIDKLTSDFIEDYILSMDVMVIMISHHLSDDIKSKIDEIIEITE